MKGGKIINDVEESKYQKYNWADISFQTRLVLSLGFISFGLFVFLEWLNAAASQSQTHFIIAGVLPLLMALGLISCMKNKGFYPYISASLFSLALINAMADFYILIMQFAKWENFAAVVLGQIIFFAVFLPNRFKYAIASVSVLTLGYVYAGYLMVENVFSQQITILTVTIAVVSLVYKYHLNKRLHRYFAEEKDLERQIQEADFSRNFLEDSAAENINLMEQLAIAEQEAKQNSQFLKAVMDHINQGIIVYDKNYKLVAWNSPLEGLLDLPEGYLRVGMAQEDILRMNAERGEYGDGDPEERLEEKIKLIQGSKDQGNFIYDRQRPNGTIMNVIGTTLPDGGIISSYIDVTKERQREEETRLMSLRDTLTGLSNRRAFKADISSAERQSKESKINFVLAMIDLDNFKPVNDTYGHPVGDVVLKDVASILRTHIRGTDSAARIGGDEFAIVFRKVKDLALVQDRVEAIIKAIRGVEIEGHEDVKIGASAGIAQYGIHANNVAGLIEVSDRALYAAKQAGKNNAVVSDDYAAA